MNNMLKLDGEKQGELLEVTTEGTATEDDLHLFKEALKAKKLQEEPLNILFIFKNIEGNTPKALWEAFKVVVHLKSIKKSAIVADDTFMSLDQNKVIPGVEIERFSVEEVDEAREWLRK